jgi:hypothetical protein
MIETKFKLEDSEISGVYGYMKLSLQDLKKNDHTRKYTRMGYRDCKVQWLYELLLV